MLPFLSVHVFFRFALRPWSIYFTIVTLLIVVTMMVPSLFGLQSFTQWGAMYSNAWCTVEFSSGDPLHTPKDALDSKAIVVGNEGKRLVWSPPQHNPESCTQWARSRCGQNTKEGWTIAWAQPMFKGVYVLELNNACDLPAPDPPWFYAIDPSGV